MQGDTAIVLLNLLWNYYCASHGGIKRVLSMFLSASSSRPQRVDESKTTLLLYLQQVLWSYYCASHCSINRRERLNARRHCYCVSNFVMKLLLCLPLHYYWGIMSVYVSQWLQTTESCESKTTLLLCPQLVLWNYYCASRCTIIWVLWVSMSASSSRPLRAD